MKLNLILKIFSLIILILSSEASRLKENPSLSIISKSTIDTNNFNSTKTKIHSYRFQDYQQMNNMQDKNLLLLNSEVLNTRPPTDKDDLQEEVLPNHANAGSEFKWSFLFFHTMYFPANNALSGGKSYWLSKRGVENDHWEAVWDFPQKINMIVIRWRLPPKRFRVFFKLDDSTEYIPVTGLVNKTSYINKEGRISSKNAISESNVIFFHKPIYARRIRINLNETVKKGSFSIFSVKFYQNRTTMLIRNVLFDQTKQYCFYVNTNKPVEGTKVQAYPCLDALTVASNNELWVQYTDNSIRHLNSKLCLGFDVENDIALRYCGDYNPSFTVAVRSDNTFYFNGYDKECIAMDESKKASVNYVKEDTEIIVTSQADNQTYKKENIRLTGENYWQSAPGQKKETIQILFGKINSGPLIGQYQTRKIDLIKIDWIKAPKKFMVYTWKPGYSWTLKIVFEDFKSKVSEIELIGEEAAAIMLVLQEANNYPELGNIPAYAIKNVDVLYNSIKIKKDSCSNFAEKTKLFDFDTQNFQKLPNLQTYKEIRKKLSLSFEKNIEVFTNLKQTMKYIEKGRLQAEDLVSKLDKLKKKISDKTIKTLRNFKSDFLPVIRNSQFREHLLLKSPSSSLLAFLGGKTQFKGNIGTKESPAIDCLSIKKLVKSPLSGWYFIKGDCNLIPIRVFCDFTIFGDAVDIYILNDGAAKPNTDISYLGISDSNSIRYQCAKKGLLPLQINNTATVERVFQLLTSMGYDLSKPIVVPLGYDYSCSQGRCNGVINSLNDRQSPSINSFFKEAGKEDRTGLVLRSGAFAGLGFSNITSMIKFEPSGVNFTALICSTNHFKTNSSDLAFKSISCDLSVSDNNDLFVQGSNVLVHCPSSCSNSSGKVYGSTQYHIKSSVCRAAIHSNVMNSTGGKIFIRVGKGIHSYQGSQANGIKSEDIQSDGSSSFSVLKYNPTCPINQFTEMAKKELIFSQNQSSFVQTSSKIKLKSKAKDNILEGVDLSDLNKIGITPDSLTKDLNTSDEVNESYNSVHGEFASDSIEEGDNAMDSNSSNGMVDSDAGSNYVDDAEAEKPEYQYNFAQVESESENNSEYDSASRTIRNNNNYNNDSRDRLISQDPNNPTASQNSMVNKMMKDIKTAGNEMLKAANPTQPQHRIPPPQTPVKMPSINDEPFVKLSNIKEPSTDEGIRMMKKIRDYVDWGYIKTVENKSEKIKSVLKTYNDSLAWSKDEAKLSNFQIKKNLNQIEKLKNKITNVMQNLSDQSTSRVLITKKIKRSWRDVLNKLEIGETFILNYNIPTDFLFKSIFTVQDAKCSIKSNWALHKEELKGRPNAIGIISKIFTKDQLIGSLLKLQTKEYFDFDLTVDILVKSNGISGVVFKMKDFFNYYAFYINKNEGYKALVKVANGRKIFLTKIEDGGILVNNWHRINIFVQAGHIRIKISDVEATKDSKSADKIIEAFDNVFSSGFIGIFVNSMEGFYFDSLKISPAKCWTPWTPITNLEILNPLSSVHYENFKGTIDKFLRIDPEETEEGMGDWKLVNSDTENKQAGIYQESTVYDKSSERRPSMLLIKDKYINHGTISVSFTPENQDGIVSIIFKYIKDTNKSGVQQESFYSFESVNSVDNPQFILKKFSSGNFKELMSVNSKVKDLPVVGYQPSVKHKIRIVILGDFIKVNLSIGASPLIEIMKVKDVASSPGLVGVGTYRTKCKFNTIEIFPPKTNLSESEKSKIITMDSDEVFFPEIPEFNDKLKGLKNSSNSNDAQSSLNSENPTNVKKNHFLESSEGDLGWKTCLKNKTTNQRTSYCKSSFSIIAMRNKCNADYCGTCCDNLADKSHKNSVYKCKKTCEKSTSGESTQSEYKQICIQSSNPEKNIYDFCDVKMSAPENKKTCKLDMCNLCCSTLDSIQHKNFNMDTVKNCFEDCNKIFNS